MLFLEELGRSLTNDYAGGHCISSGHTRHDRAVSNAQIVDAVNLEPAVNDRHFIAAHLCRAVLMQVSRHRISHEALKRAPLEVARHHLTLDEGAHRSGITDLATKRDRADQCLHISRIRKRVGNNFYGIGWIWPGDADGSSAARANDTRQHRP